MKCKVLTALCLTVLAICLLACPLCAAPGRINSVSAGFGNEADRALSSVLIQPPSAEMGSWEESTSEEAIKLNYSAHRVFGAYRLMYYFSDTGAVSGNYWVTVTYKTNTAEKAKLVFASNAGAYAENPLWGVNLFTLSDNVSISGGNWVTTDPVCINVEGSQLPARLAAKQHNTLYFDIKAENAEVYVKEMRFFASKKDAEAYAANSGSITQLSEPAVYKMTTSSEMRQSIVMIVGDNTLPVFDSEAGGVRLKYDDIRTQDMMSYRLTASGAYRMQFQFFRRSALTNAHRYVCVTYKTDCDGKYSLSLSNAARTYSLTLTDDISASKGEYVTSAPAKLTQGFNEYILNGKNLWLNVNTINRNVNFHIKEIAFFTSEAQAKAYYSMKDSINSSGALTIVGTPISDYTVIVPEADSERLASAAKTVADAIEAATGKKIEIKTDAEPVVAHEILIGNTNREESHLLYNAAIGRFSNGQLSAIDFTAFVRNGKLVIGADMYAVLEQTIGQFAEAYLTSRAYNFENGFDVSCFADDRAGAVSDTNYTSTVKFFKFFPTEDIETTFDTPNTYKDSFEGEAVGSDPDYWTENPIGEGGLDVVVPLGTTVDFTSYEEFSKNALIQADLENSANSKKDIGYYDAWIGSMQFMDGYVQVNARPGGMTSGGAFRLAFIPKKNVLSDAQKYVNVTYKIEAPKNIKGALELRMVDSVIVIDSEVGDTNGEWVVSSAIDVSAESTLFSRWKSGALHNAICFNFGPEYSGIKVYVKEVSFFNDISVGEAMKKGELSDLAPAPKPSEVNNYFKIAADGDNIVYSATAKDGVFSWLHVFERDVDYTVRMKLTSLEGGARAGVACRVNDEEAYVIAGYDASMKKWFIESRQGTDFMPHRIYSAESAAELNRWYTLRLVAENRKISLYIDGSDLPIVSSDNITHYSSGKAALYAENSSVMFDDVSLTLTSCQSRVQDGVISYTIPNDSFIEGGTVLPLTNGELLYLHQSLQLTSNDMGLSWMNTYWANIVQHANVLRLKSGKILRLEETEFDGKMYYSAAISADEGKTWTGPYAIAPMKWQGTTGSSCIMNDKFMQMSDGRIFFSCTYNGVQGKTAIVEIFYSDDDGITWTKSQTSSLDITKSTHFGESKIVETSEGTLRMLTSWNNDGYMTYSESKDNGVTWGELVPMKEFQCSNSSYDVYRDPETGVYYLVWVYNELRRGAMPRARLSLAMSTDGINWSYCMDVDRWDTPIAFENAQINHMVDPFVKVVGDYIFIGTGMSESLGDYQTSFHKGQCQRIYRIEKSAIAAYDKWPSAYGKE